MLCRPGSLRDVLFGDAAAASYRVLQWGTAHGPLLRQGALRGHDCPFAPGEGRGEAYRLTGKEARFEEGLPMACHQALEAEVELLARSGEWLPHHDHEAEPPPTEAGSEARRILLLPGHMADLAVSEEEQGGGGGGGLRHPATGLELQWQPRRRLRLRVPLAAPWGLVEPVLRRLLPLSPEPVPPVLLPCSAAGREANRRGLEQPRAFRLADAETVLREPGWWGSKPTGSAPSSSRSTPGREASSAA